MNTKLNLAICISGGGTTMLEVIKACASNRLPRIKPSLIITSNPEASGIDKALKAGISHQKIVSITSKNKPKSQFTEEFITTCDKHKIDLIALCGFIPLIPQEIISSYQGRIFNQHPGPLDNNRPGFGGKGMRGRAVHQAVILFAKNISRVFASCATTHQVSTELDTGTIIGMQPVEVYQHDTAESLATRMLPSEHALVVQTLYNYAEQGVFTTLDRKEPLIHSDELTLLEETKKAAISHFPKG